MVQAREIDPDAVKEKLDTGSATVVDIRDPQTVAMGMLPGAVHVGQDNLEAFLAETDKQQPLIVYCYHGHSSRQAAAFFAEQGFDEVYSMRGGYALWSQTYPST